MFDKSTLKTLKQAEIAALIGVSDRRIQQLHHEGLPRNGEGRGTTYDWDLVRGWWEARISGSEGDGKKTGKARKDEADADMAEMNRDLQAGNLLERQDVVRTWTAFLGRLRDHLLGLPDRAAPEVLEGMALAERIAVLRKHVNHALREVVAQLQDEEAP